MTKRRGLKEIDHHLGALSDLIRARSSADPLIIVEVGCGHGVAMVELAAELGPRARLVGINESPRDGNPDAARRAAEERGLRLARIPEFIYCDVDAGLPFDPDSVDVVYSIAAYYVFRDKVVFLESCATILKPGGVARISPSHHFKNESAPATYSEWIEIWDSGHGIGLPEYCARLEGIELITPSDGEDRDYIEIAGRSGSPLDMGLKLVTSIPMNALWPEWGGVKSIYATRRSSRSPTHLTWTPRGGWS